MRRNGDETPADLCTYFHLTRIDGKPALVGLSYAEYEQIAHGTNQPERELPRERPRARERPAWVRR